ncbi:MAG: 3-isopropylmalate dehydrogenase [Verrucomicrobiota bacterium]
MKIAVLSGDGIGPEVMKEAIKVLDRVAERFDFNYEVEEALVGGAAIDGKGKALPQETIDVCEQSEAILFGSVGGPKWESLPPHEQPERAALLPLRKHFGLYVNLRPGRVYPELRQASPVQNERIPDGFDILVVRELTGGIYFGEPKKTETIEGGYERAIDTLVYETPEIERVTHLGFKAAQARSKKLTLIDKANVLESSILWRKTVTRLAAEYPDVELNFMYVDNAAMQVLLNPSQFDVMLCENMFGDIISDEVAAATGSLGLLPSASLADGSFGLYEPSGGSAPDIAGQGIANPVAQILSLAMMLEFSFDLKEPASVIRDAVEKTIQAGIRTGDIWSEGCQKVGTQEMGDAICSRI